MIELIVIITRFFGSAFAPLGMTTLIRLFPGRIFVLVIRPITAKISIDMKYTWSLLFLIIPFSIAAQKQGNVWYFGTQCGFDFATGAPTVITGGMTGTNGTSLQHQEGTSCISDSIGRILFYTGGYCIWNSNHKVMPNGDSILGNASSTQSSIIIPKPGNNNLYYVFTSDAQENYINPPNIIINRPKGYRYTLVDMCLDSNRGDVVKERKNVLLCDSGTEKLSACYDGRGGYWIVGHKIMSAEFYAWHLTAGGITDTVISTVGLQHGFIAPGNTVDGAACQMKFSPSGTRLAASVVQSSYLAVDLFSFNLTTGVVNATCRIPVDSPTVRWTYGLEFSPDGSRLYAFSQRPKVQTLYQYSLTKPVCDSVIASRHVIYRGSSSNNISQGGMQVGPDGKLYVCMTHSGIIGCIKSPNASGSLCNFDSAFLNLNLRVSTSPLKTFPSFVAGYKYFTGMPCGRTVPLRSSELQGKGIEFLPNPFDQDVTLRLGNGEPAEVRLTIMNTIGQAISDLMIDSNPIKLNFSNLPSGMYFYQITQRGLLVKTGTIQKR